MTHATICAICHTTLEASAVHDDARLNGLCEACSLVAREDSPDELARIAVRMVRQRQFRAAGRLLLIVGHLERGAAT